MSNEAFIYDAIHTPRGKRKKDGSLHEVKPVTLNCFCASGLKAVNMAAMKVRSGWEDLVVLGGVESMYLVPRGSDGRAWATDPATNLTTGFIDNLPVLSINSIFPFISTSFTTKSYMN